MAEEIRAEIVGNVLKILAREGAELSCGDTVLLIESMKMEIPVIVETAGRLSRVVVVEGDVIRDGDVLAVLEGEDDTTAP